MVPASMSSVNATREVFEEFRHLDRDLRNEESSFFFLIVEDDTSHNRCTFSSIEVKIVEMCEKLTIHD